MNFKELKDLECRLRLSASLATDDEGSLVLCFGEIEQKTRQVFQNKTYGADCSNDSTTVGRSVTEFRCGSE